jgi:hypothetical protein
MLPMQGGPVVLVKNLGECKRLPQISMMSWQYFVRPNLKGGTDSRFGHLRHSEQKMH